MSNSFSHVSNSCEQFMPAIRLTFNNFLILWTNSCCINKIKASAGLKRQKTAKSKGVREKNNDW